MDDVCDFEDLVEQGDVAVGEVDRGTGSRCEVVVGANGSSDDEVVDDFAVDFRYHLIGHEIRQGGLGVDVVDGLEVLRRLRAEPRTRLLPVVILTTSREEQDLITSYQLGANSYICKPVDFAQFTEAVRQLGLYWLVLNEAPPCPRS